MENDIARIGLMLVILPKTCYQTIIAVPQVNLSDTYKMNGIINRLIMMQGDTVEIDPIANTNGTLTENLLSIGKRDYRRHFAIEPVAKQLVNL